MIEQGIELLFCIEVGREALVDRQLDAFEARVEVGQQIGNGLQVATSEPESSKPTGVYLSAYTCCEMVPTPIPTGCARRRRQSS